MPDPYRSTQRSLFILSAALVPFVTMVVLVMTMKLPVGLVPVFLVVVLVVSNFAALAVTVDADAVRIRFGVGIGRRTIPLSAIRGVKIGHAPWYAGVGMRWLGAGSWLYNVSTGPVVELALEGGRRVLIGTREPEALLAAIEARRPSMRTHGVSEFDDSVRIFGVTFGVLALVVTGVAAMIYADSRPPRIKLDATTLTVSSAVYTSRTDLNAITSVALVDLPPVFERKTNGFAFNGHLRGHFSSSQLGGAGMVFIDRGYPPYLLVRTADGFVLLNSPVADSTRTLAERLKRAGSG